MLTYTAKRVWTTEELYPKGYTIPEGYQFVDFRPPIAGDYFLFSPSGIVSGIQGSGHPYNPRIIVRPIPKRKVYTFRATGQVGPLQKGNWYKQSTTGDFIQWTLPFSSVSFFDIYTFTESEE